MAAARSSQSTDRPPLSFPQQRLWFLDQLSPASALYNVPIVLDLEGPLDAGVLHRVLEAIVHRHEPLRTSFPAPDGEPYQRVAAIASFELPVEDLSVLDPDRRDWEVDRHVLDEARRPFALADGPMFRARLVRLGATRHVLIVVVHHIVFDAWSAGIFLRELAALYDAFSHDRPSPLPDVPLRYVEFARTQREWLASNARNEQLAYWIERLKPPRPVLDLPADRPRPPVQSFRGDRRRIVIPNPLVTAVEQFSRREGVTAFITLLTVYGILLHRYTGQDDLIVGSPIANRTRPELESLIGFFVNTLALRLDASGDPTVRELLGRIRRAAFEAYSHQDLPFELLVEQLNPERSLSHSPIIQTMLVFDNTPYGVRDRVRAGELTLARHEVDTGTSKFDTTLLISRGLEGWRATLEYSTDLYNPPTATRMLTHYQQLLEAAVAAPDERIGRLPMLPQDERRRLLVDWNATHREYGSGPTVVARFEQQAAYTPDAVALMSGPDRLTYRDLNCQANAIAHRLQEAGTATGDRVAIFLPRSASLVAAILGALKAGAAYVPLDPDYPPDRLEFMAADAAVTALLTVSSLAAIAPRGAWATLCLDRDVGSPTTTGPSSRPCAEDLAYIIYTSGSTGRPKGVAVEHRSVDNLIAFALETFTRDELMAVLASTSTSFDVSVFEMFAPLSVGGAIVLVDNLPVWALSPEPVPVTLVSTVPSVLAEILRVNALPEGPRVIVLAGEPLRADLVDRLYERQSIRKVFDFYGPSECTVYATCALRERHGPTTIGRPIANMRAYVLDRQQQPAPVGVPGELWLGGVGLARGYFGRPDLTAERFVDDPFDGPPSRLYRTGDRARWRSDGTLEYLGRLDDQVKLRGYRIELGEIEAMLREHTAIVDAVVSHREDERGDATLVAHVVTRASADEAQLREWLARRLPTYMVPSAFVPLESLPRLPNGKINRAALPRPDAPREGTGRRANASGELTPIEQRLAALWAELLQVPAVGIDQDFFSLGGHSLLAVRLFAELHKRFGVKLPISSLFRNGTVREQAQLVAHERMGDEAWSPVVPIHPHGTRPPFFLVHGIGGEVLSFQGLAQHVACEQPIFGLQADMRQGAAFFGTVEDVAATYLRHVRSASASGPYHLGGYSSGGIIAYEMAQQLVAAGERVSSLVMLDSPVPGASEGPLTLAAAWRILRNAVYWLIDDEFLRLSRRDRRRRLMSKWRALFARDGGDLRDRLGLWHMGEEARSYLEAHYRMVRSYCPRPYAGPIVVLRARTLRLGSRAPADLGWGRLASGGVTVLHVPGAHDTILKEPHVRLLAVALVEALRGSNRTASPARAPEPPSESARD